jgi:hypothetical protein
VLVLVLLVPLPLAMLAFEAPAAVGGLPAFLAILKTHPALAARHLLHSARVAARMHRIFWPWHRSHAERLTALIKLVRVGRNF